MTAKEAFFIGYRQMWPVGFGVVVLHMVGLVIVLIVASLWLIGSSVVASVAEDRGHSPVLWYFFALLCSPLVAFIFLEATPKSSVLGTPMYQVCRHCSRTVEFGIAVCPYCDFELREPAKAKTSAAA